MVGAIAAVAIYVYYFRAGVERISPVNVAIVDDAAQLQSIRARPHVLFRNTALGNAYGQIV